MSTRERYHVTHDDDGWKVQKEGAERASARTDTKEQAVSRGRELASGASGQLLVHGMNGKIQEERTYGSDPERYPG